MLYTSSRAPGGRLVPVLTAALLIAAPVAQAQVLPPHPNAPKANWVLFDKFSPASMRGMVFSTNIIPRWIGETDSMFYSWKDHTGERWFLVDARKRTKQPLFNHHKLATQLSVASKKAVEAFALSDEVNMINITRDHKNLRFSVDSQRFNWNLATETLTSIGRYRGAQDSMLTKDEETDGTIGFGRGGDGGGGGSGRAAVQDYRNYSPDSSAFVYARNHNLYIVDKGSNDTLQLTRAGSNASSFGGRDDGGPGRAAVTWSGDSKAFHITRYDSRGVKNGYNVRSLAEPRPTLMAYQYAMPGEDGIARPEVWSYVRGDIAARKAPIDKWRDQRLAGTPQVGVVSGGGNAAGPGQPQWVGNSGTTMRFVRRDRLQRNVEFVELDVVGGESKVLVSDTKGAFGSIEIQAPIYVKKGGDFIWFSERDGWGHYYLYSNDGKLKRQLTSGEWRADQIVALDSVRNIAWIRGQGREKGENPYYQHLYRVSLVDGSITLLDGGNFNHNSLLSTNRNWIVDLSSRMDTLPRVQLRDASNGKAVMDLETADLSRLQEAGWKYAETFEVLAADGVTRIFGNMWKPFDFDSTKKYPIIAHVYPGPQMEWVGIAFNVPPDQQLAQLGFIVIQIGNRGGSPGRSAAYQDFGYYNWRDYALADKKYGIEQLASRHKWIDLDRVGIYGRSGGGSLTATALLLPPYNEFFKVGVSEAGGHDMNIYQFGFPEQYHGLKWVAAADTARLTAEARSKGRTAEFFSGKQIAAAKLSVGNRTAGVAGRGGATGNAGNGGRAAVALSSANAAPDSVFWIYVPTNIDIASNLKGKLMITTGDEDDNTNPSHSIRLVNALMQSGKRFDYFLYPGQGHEYTPYATEYAFRLQAEYFSEFLLGDRGFRNSADFMVRK